MTNLESTQSLNRLIDIGIALSSEKDMDSLIERIFQEAQRIAKADGATLYIRTKQDTLQFVNLHTGSLGISQGGSSGIDVTLSAVPMYLADGEPNFSNMASYVAITGEMLNLADAYNAEPFDFSGTRRFDEKTGYRSQSILTVPLKNIQGRVIGIMQLLNAQGENGEVIAFNVDYLPVIEALASQAAVALEKQQLIDTQQNLLNSFIELIAAAVDAKSPYTGGHCQRVPILTKSLVQAACDQKDGPFREFELSEDDWYQLHLAAWLHDCGKVTTPEYVVDKATKLETITDRIHEVRMRFELLKKDAENNCLRGLLENPADEDQLKAELEAELASLDEEFSFIAQCNIGGEFMEPKDIARVQQIAKRQWTRTLDDRLGISRKEAERKAKLPSVELPVKESLLADRADHILEHDSVIHAADPDNPYGFKVKVPEHKYNLGEIYNLSIEKGTLTEEERFKINDHIVQTIVMLEQLQFPDHLAKIPEYAGGHHEKMDGTGYPKSVSGDDMSVPAKVMAIADIFEALTAADRPYKPPKSLNESIRIMSFMAKDDHIDRDLFALFLNSGIYRQYAEEYLQDHQIDAVDISQYLTA